MGLSEKFLSSRKSNKKIKNAGAKSKPVVEICAGVRKRTRKNKKTNQ